MERSGLPLGDLLPVLLFALETFSDTLAMKVAMFDEKLRRRGREGGLGVSLGR